MKKIIIYISFFLVNTGCIFFDPIHRVNIKNNSNHKIFVSCGIPLYGMNNFPDTILPSNKPGMREVDAHGKAFLNSHFKWEKYFNQNNASQISFYYFDFDSISKNSWSYIVSSYLILKRSDLTLDSLKRCNWTITYP